MDLKALREEFAGLHAENNKILTAASKEKRELSGEESAANTQRFARMDIIQAQVDDAKKLAKYSIMNGEAELPHTPPGKREFDAERGGKVEFDKDAVKSAINSYARTGDVRQATNFTLTTGTQSGVYLPKEVVPAYNVRRLPNAVRAVLAFYGVPVISRSLTESISLPVQDDTGNTGQAQSQSATSGTAVDPDVTGSITLNPTLYSSKQQWLSNTVVNAVDFDVFAYLLPMLTRRLDKAQESAWITNIKTNATVGKTTASPTAITYAEWLGFEHSLSAAYRSDGAFILSDSVYQLVRGLVDDQHRPIMDLDPTNSFQATIHGKPVFISDYFDTAIATHVVGAFASADALKILDAGLQRIARYILQPAYPDQTGFELFANGDGQFVSAGVRTLVMHA